jgi:limonene-1,2-epoxide hydrolase
MFAHGDEFVKAHAATTLVRIALDGKLRFTTPIALAVIASVLIVGCGGDSDSDEPAPPEASTTEPIEVPGDAEPQAVAVIGAWVDALRRGDVEAAAEYFAIPSIAENGPLLTEIDSRADAVRFNESLPCGARLIRAETSGEFTTATFRLTERPGPGRCGAGTGETAKTTFVIRDGRIVEWRRVGAGGAPEPKGEAV